MRAAIAEQLAGRPWYTSGSTLQVTRLTGPRVVLVGDAAHAGALPDPGMGGSPGAFRAGPSMAEDCMSHTYQLNAKQMCSALCGADQNARTALLRIYVSHYDLAVAII